MAVTLRRIAIGAIGTAIVGIVGIVASGCSSDRRPSSGITIDTLAASTGTACSVPLDAAVTASGVERTEAATGSVDVARSFTSTTTDAPSDSTLLDALDAISVRCSVVLGDGSELRLLLVAGRQGNAGVALLPTIAREADLTADRVQQVGNDLPRTKVGALVSVPGDAPIAVLATEIKGATSSWMMVAGPSLTRLQVEQIARQLDQRLR